MPSAYDPGRAPLVPHGPTRAGDAGPRLVALRRAEALVRRLAALRDPAELRDQARALVLEARAVVADLDATSREPVDQAPAP